MKIQYLLVIALVSGTFAQNTNQLATQQENQVNNNTKSDATNNLQNIQNPVSQNNNIGNTNITQYSQDLETRLENIINLALGKSKKNISIDRLYTAFPNTVYKIIKENNITDCNTIEPLWTKLINKDKVAMDSFKKQLEEYATSSNVPNYSPIVLKEIIDHYLNYVYPYKYSKCLDDVINSTEFPEFVKNYVEFYDAVIESLPTLRSNDVNIVFSKLFTENKQKIMDKFNIIKNQALDSESRMHFSDNPNDKISVYLVPLFMSDFEQNITNINTIEGLKEFISSDIVTKPVNYILNRHNAIYPKLKKNNPKEDSKLTMYIDYLVYCVENYSTSAIIHCVQNYAKKYKDNPEGDKEYKISKLLLDAIKKSPNPDLYKDIINDLEQSAAKY